MHYFIPKVEGNCYVDSEMRVTISESFATYCICSYDKAVNFTGPLLSHLENEYNNCLGLLWILGKEDT